MAFRGRPRSARRPAPRHPAVTVVGQRVGREPGPQHDAIGQRVAGGHAEAERIAVEGRSGGGRFAGDGTRPDQVFAMLPASRGARNVDVAESRPAGSGAGRSSISRGQ